MKSHNLRYPWVSTFGALLLISYLFLSTQQELITFYQIPPEAFGFEFQLPLIIVLFACVLTDMKIFYQREKNYKLKITSLNQQINDLLMAKKKLQNKAHTFSGHADKLKLFISDRLLEYIEYDEKFLHFKSIASEVRHTGVICFDKVQTALSLAIETPSKKNTEHYQDALNSMVYLWDLLELSTTDNLALHIADQLCESEERYYQSLLKNNELTGNLSSPVFSAQSAALRALNRFLEKPLSYQDETPVIKTDKAFAINLETVAPLLGNENHIVLLLENLINNAVFYSNKKPYSHKYARTSVQLKPCQGYARFSVYNHGPHIDNEEKGQIFQLGYSTRKVREHNGKGLGLYFVDQIIKGYEGTINFENISNTENTYSIRIAFADGSVVTEVIETKLFSHRVKCLRANEENLSNKVEWSSKEQVASIEVSMQAEQKTFSFTEMDKPNNVFTDPEAPSMPRWIIEITQRKRSSKIVFSPLDINGVRFFVNIPTAESRLDYSESLDAENHLNELDLDSMREDFIDPDRLSA